MCRWSRAGTPTPVPGYGNVMQVTIDPSLPTPVPVLRSGAQGEAVWQLQERLQALGYLTGSVDGQFGPATKEAVQLFQRQHGLTADGIVGEDTRQLARSATARSRMPRRRPRPPRPRKPPKAPAADDMILLTAEAEDTVPVGFTADGLPLLVNRDSPLPDVDHRQPQQLVNMRDYCDSSIVSIKGSEIEGEQIAVDALLAMLTQAQSEGLDIMADQRGIPERCLSAEAVRRQGVQLSSAGHDWRTGAQCGAQSSSPTPDAASITPGWRSTSPCRARPSAAQSRRNGWKNTAGSGHSIRRDPADKTAIAGHHE